MYYFSELCYICLKNRKQIACTDVLSDNITYYKKIITLAPELSKAKANQFNYVCHVCSKILDIMYEFRQKCIKNMNIFESYLAILRGSSDNVIGEVNVVLHDIKNAFIKDNIYKGSDVTHCDDVFVDTSNVGKVADDEYREGVRNTPITNLKETPNLADEKTQESEIKNDFFCYVCHKSVQTEKALIKHQKIHTRKNTFKCSICDKTCNNLKTLKDHECLKPKQYSCDICNEMFLWKSYMIVHKVRHNTEATYKCEICNKILNSRATLQSHVRVHLGERPFKCNICNKKFTQLAHLITHKRVHSGEKPYTYNEINPHTTADKDLISSAKVSRKVRTQHGHKCSSGSCAKCICKKPKTYTPVKSFVCTACNKGFIYPSQLKLHMRIHTGEKSFKCDLCTKSFYIADYLKAHRRTHTGEKPYTCITCGRSFSQFGNLKTHIRTHTGEKPYKCDICNKRFIQLCHLQRHMYEH